MPILNDRITDQIHELLPEYMNEEGQGFKQFITAYFDFLEKGILIFEQGTDLEKIGLEDGEGSVLQETETFSPSPLDKAKLLFEQNAVGQTQTGSWEIGEYVVGSTSGATARIDVLATEDNKLYVETFTESQFLPAETIIGQNSGYTAKVNKFEGGALFAANNLLDYADVDKTTGDFLEYFRRDFMPSIDSKIIADKRLLAKHINNIYLTKGSMASYDFLFRVLYNEDIEVSYPRDNMIKPSDSKWTESTVLNLHSTKNLLEYSQGKIVKRNTEQDIITEIQADTITRATSGEGDNVYQVVIMEPYTGSLLIGDTIELQSRTNPLKFHNATVRGIVSDMDETSGSVLIKMESGTGFVSSESDDSEGFQLETATDSLVAGTNNLILLETATQTDNSINEVHGKTPIIVRETVNTVNTEAVIGGSMKSEEASTGSLYTQSENVVVNLPQSELGVGQAAKALVGNVEDSKIEKVIIDPAVRGTGYNDGDIVVFDNTGSGGTLAQGEVTSISGDILLESGTTFGSFEFTATSGQTTFSGRDKHNSLLVYDPDKVLVRVKRSDASQTIASQGGGVSFSVFEEVRGSANVGLNGQSIVFTGTYAQNGHANYVGQAGTVIEVFAEPEETTLILEDGLQSTGENKLLFDQSGANPTGAIARVRITTSGIGYTSLPKAYVGGEVFYSETTTPNFTIGETITSGTTTGILVDHDKGARKLVIGKLQTTTDTTTFTVGSTLTGSASGATATSIQNSFTTGVGARLLPYGDSIGSIGKLRVIESGNHFNKSQGIPNYAHHFIIGRMSANPVAGASVTGSISNATATIQSFNGDTGVISLEDITGFFKLGEDVTVSDGKTFTILEGNPATVSAKNSPISKVDGNYTSDVGFPSVTAQRIQDSLFYQDFSYVIKVGQSINKYRSVVQQLLNPAGTIFFGEVAISNKIDGSAETYRSGSNTEGFDGDRITRSFIPTLYIGSKIDPAKIILEEGTVASGEEDVFYAEEQNIILESGDGVAVTERFLADDRLTLTVSTTGMSPAGSTTFTVGETVSQNVFKTASGDVATITGRVLSSNSTTLVVDQIRPDNTAIKQLISEGGRGGIYGLFMETGGAWKTAQSNTDITFVHGIVGASSGAKAIVNGVVDASVKTDQGSGQAFIVGEDITESDVGLYDRIIRANVTAHGHEVVKEVDILPHYAHTRLYYTTLNNAITIGQTVKGASSGKLGRVMEHDTVNKFIIVWEGSDSLGANLGSFTTEAITNESGGTTHFTATTVQEHHVNEGIVKVDIGHNSPVSVPSRPSLSVDPKRNIAVEFYEGANRQQRKNITILQTFASANTKSGRTLTIVPDSKEDANQQGLRGSGATTTIALVGGLEWGETIKSATSGSIINNIEASAKRTNTITSFDGSNTIVKQSDRNNVGGLFANAMIPSDAKRINSVANVDEEFIITEDGSYLIEEIDHGFLMAEPEPEKYNSYTTTDGYYYVGDLWSVDPTEELTLEDGSRLALEDATDLEKHERFVTERSYNLGSYFMKTEEQDTLVLEDDSRLIQENAISFGEPVERLGPTLGDLAKIGFSQTLIKEENIIQEGGDDILMENEGGKLLIEAPYEGVKISDISTLYPKESVSDLQEHVGRSMILSHPASIHIDNGTALGM